jgi:hypothetical protein
MTLTQNRPGVQLGSMRLTSQVGASRLAMCENMKTTSTQELSRLRTTGDRPSASLIRKRSQVRILDRPLR